MNPSPYWRLGLLYFILSCGWQLAAELAINVADKSKECPKFRLATWMTSLMNVLCALVLLPLVWNVGGPRNSVWKLLWPVPLLLQIGGLILSIDAIHNEWDACHETHRTYTGFTTAALVWHIIMTGLCLAFIGLVVALRTLSGTFLRKPVNANAAETSVSNPLHVDVMPLAQVLSASTALANAGDTENQKALGTLGMTISPGRKNASEYRDLATDLARMREQFQCQAIVTFLEPVEIEFMSLRDYSQLCSGLGMEWIHFPVHDKWTPPDMLAYNGLVQKIVGLLRNGRNVVIHCNGGKGRTGLTVVLTLMMLGVPTVGEAIALTRKTRPGTIKNPLQIMYAHEFIAHWRAGTLPSSSSPSSFLLASSSSTS